MRRRLAMIPLFLLMIAGAGFVVMNLWNWLVPALFAGRMITFGQSLGVLALSRILFGGFFRRARFVNRWEQLTPEEREKFRAGMRRKCGPGPSVSPAEA